MSKATYEIAGLTGSFSKDNMNNQFHSIFQGDSSPLRPRAQSTPNMTIAVLGTPAESYYSPFWVGGDVPANYTAGNSPAISAPSANPRIDLLYLNSSNALAWITGTESASPSAPNFGLVGVPICYIYCKTTMTTIVNYEDKDANPTQGYIYRDIRPTSLSVSTEVTGKIEMWGGSIANIPSGYLLCNGDAISRTNYADLFVAISVIHGAGDGSTTFNLPDLRDKFLVGAKQDDGGKPKSNIEGSLNQAGGNTSHNHSTTVGGTTSTASGNTYVDTSWINPTTPGPHSHTFSGSGTSDTKKHIPSYYVMTYMIKT